LFGGGGELAMKNRIAALEAIKQKGARLAHKLTGSEEQGVGKELQQGLRTTEAYLTKHPGMCLGIALSIGVVLGWLLKRK
jgi:ElaB/YqjD/DUF883 family membrane-anchored ribosome-binding protein